MKFVLILMLAFFINNSAFAQFEQEEPMDGKIKMVVIKDKIYKFIKKDGEHQKEFMKQLFLGIGNYNANKDEVQLNKMLINLNLIFEPNIKKVKNNKGEYYLTGCMFADNVLLILPFSDKCDNSPDNATDKIIKFNFQST